MVYGSHPLRRFDLPFAPGVTGGQSDRARWRRSHKNAGTSGSIGTARWKRSARKPWRYPPALARSIRRKQRSSPPLHPSFGLRSSECCDIICYIISFAVSANHDKLLQAYLTYFIPEQRVVANRCVLLQALASSRIGLCQFEGLVPERVCWFKSSPQQINAFSIKNCR